MHSTGDVKALELRRKAGDERGAAMEQNSMGMLFEYRAATARHWNHGAMR